MDPCRPSVALHSSTPVPSTMALTFSQRNSLRTNRMRASSHAGRVARVVASLSLSVLLGTLASCGGATSGNSSTRPNPSTAASSSSADTSPKLSLLAGVAPQARSIDGTGHSAMLNAPTGVAIDRSGTLYVAEIGASDIRRITPQGVVTTVAGVPGVVGSADGTGAAARFSTPCGIAADGAGTLYVADTGNSAIRKISPSGVVTTLAGSAGLTGSADGTGAAAHFNRPCGIAIDDAGNLFVADTGNSTIRRISPAGRVSTLAGAAGHVGAADGQGA